MTTARRIAAIFRSLSPTLGFAVFLLVCEQPAGIHAIVQKLRVSQETARRHLLSLARAGLLVNRPRLGGAMEFHGNPQVVTVQDDTIAIDAGGLPFTVGRHLKE